MLKNISLSFLIGAVLFIGWHFLLSMNWSHEGSLDIFSGALVDFFIFQLLLYFHNQKREKSIEKQMEAHFVKIEQMLKRVRVNEHETK